MPSVELMTTETFNLGEAAVGVADIFEGTNPPVEFLTKRAGDMLRANPWLAGRLRFQALARGVREYCEYRSRPGAYLLSE